LDVCEIGEQVGFVGQVKQVKVLGIMALLDEGETDWKILVVDVNDPLASKLNDIEDVERHLPGLIRATNEWFRYVKLLSSFQVFISDWFSGSTKSVRLGLMYIPSSLADTPAADGKPENAFAFSGEAKNKKYATEIIHECHEAWRRLIMGESPAKTATYDLSM
jgi:inorganic pyrophosphatase